MLKILYFSGGYQFFQILPGIKSLYDRSDRDRKLIHILARETYFATGVVISGHLSTLGKPPGRISLRHLDRVLFIEH